MQTGKPIIESGWARALLLFIFIVVIYSLGLYFFSFGIGNVENTVTSIQFPLYGPLSAIELMVLLSSTLSLITVILFCRLINHVPISSLGFSLRNLQSFAGILLPPALIGIGTMILYWTNHLSWIAWGFEPQLLLAAVIFLFIISFTEEVIFRGYILQNLMQSFNRSIAVLISSFLFSCMHMGNPEMNVLSFANLFAAGMLLGAGYLYTRSLWFSVFFHFCWNFFQGPVLGYPVSGIKMDSMIQTSITGDEMITGGLFGFEGSVISLALILITFLVLIWKMEKSINVSN